MRMRSVCMAACVAVALAPASAEAQADLEQARARFEQGVAQFENGSYALALESFRRSYALLDGSPRQPRVLFNIGRCHEALGQLTEARDAYSRYVASTPTGDPQRARAEERVRDLEVRIRASGSASAPQAQPATGQPATDQPATGQPATGQPATSSEGGDGDALLGGGLATLGVGAAGLISWAIFGGLAAAEHGTLESGCGATRSCTEDEVGDLRVFNTVADISLGVGVAAAAVGLVLVIVAATSTPERQVSVYPWGDAQGGGLAMAGSFR